MTQLYDRPVSALMREMLQSFSLDAGQIFTRQEAIRWFASNYPKVKLGTVAAHLILLSANDPTRYHYGARQGADDLLFKVQPGRYRLYDAEKDPSAVGFTAPTGVAKPIEDEVEGNDDGTYNDTEFAYERDLRNYLAKNLGIIEPGLRLYDDGEGITGIEFPVGSRRIDILAVDKGSNYVVVELKVSQAYDRVVGQLLRYMGWIEQHHADPGETVRGVIVASDISDDLRLACSRVDGVRLYKYSLAVTLEPVATQLTARKSREQK